MPARISDEIREKVCQDYLKYHYSSRKLGEMYNISKTTVTKILKENNIPIVNYRLVNNDLKEDYFDIIDNEYKAYFLGFLFADGSVNDKQLTLDINERDIENIYALRQQLNSNCKVTTRKKGNSSMSVMAIVNRKLVQSLNKYGIIRNKTENTYHLPFDLIPELYYKDFLRGLIDGDGWIIHTKEDRYVIGFVTRYHSVAEDFVYMLNKIIKNKWNNKILDRNEKYSSVQIQSLIQVKEIANIAKFV